MRTLMGKTLCLQVCLDQTVAAFKKSVEARTKVFAEYQRLLLASRQLDDAKTLAECGVGDGSTVQLLLRLRGGSPLDGAGRKALDMEEAVFDLYTRVCAWCERESVPSKELSDSQKKIRGFKDELVKEQERLDCLVVSADERAVRKALHSKFDNIYELLEETANLI